MDAATQHLHQTTLFPRKHSRHIPLLSQTDEPELFDLIKFAQNLLLDTEWVQKFAEDWGFINQKSLGIGNSVYHIGLTCSQYIELQKLLEVFNSSSQRLAWDNIVSGIAMKRGKSLLDSIVSIKKYNLPDCIDFVRIVREHEGRVVIIEAERSISDWPYREYNCVFINNEDATTKIDVLNSTYCADQEEAYKVRRLWASRLYQTLLYPH